MSDQPEAFSGKAKRLFKKYLPQIAKVIENFKIENKEEKKRLKKTFAKSILWNGLCLAIWGGWLVIQKIEPSLSLANQNLSSALVKSTQFGKAEAYATLAKFGFMLSGIIAAKYDLHWLNYAFGSIDHSVRPAKAQGLSKENFFKRYAKRASLIIDGIKYNPTLRKKIVICAGAEFVADAMDVYASASQSFPGWVGSILVSQAIAIKSLDLSLKAYECGIQVELSGQSQMASVRLLNAIGLSGAAKNIETAVEKTPFIKKALDKCEKGMLGVIAVDTATIVRSAINYGIAPISSTIEVETNMLAVAAALTSAITFATGCVVGLAYMKGRRQNHSPS